jgi:SPP1 family predicted phage head-tail adaptor|tara:strand:- start:323 stop:667 length:345 start_codon:yes stop_codon:yes gene_type:complete
MPSVSQVGKLRNKILIQNTVLSSDSMGGNTTARTTAFTCFAEIIPKSGSQKFGNVTGEQVENPHTYEFKIRYRSGITTTMRILFGTRTFDIIEINNFNELDNYLKLKAIENVGT